MFLVSKKVKSYTYLIMLCSGIYVAKAMEQPSKEMEKKGEEEQQERKGPFKTLLSKLKAKISPKRKIEGQQENPLESLPAEIKIVIIGFLESAKDEKEAIRNIKALSLTSKEFYNLINDPQFLGDFIKAISEQFNLKSPIDVALAFSTPSALTWLKEYMEQHPQEKIQKELANQRLVESSKAGNKSLAEFLLNVGANVNTAGVLYGATPLHWAAGNGHKDIVALLLYAGADVNQANEHGDIPLHWAAGKGDKDIVELLLKHRADINKANNSSITPLHLAVDKGQKDIAELLLKHGADVNQVSRYGSTPLNSAARSGYRDIVELLLKAGADVNRADNKGRTPLSWAAEKGHKDIVKLLHQYGA
jgi:ankyrin repeat protein